MPPSISPSLSASNGFNGSNTVDSAAKSASPAVTSPTSGTKRKRTAEPKYYAVRIGHKPGVYHTWAECLEQVKGFKGPIFKSFPTLTEAESFFAGNAPAASSKPNSFYAVQNGRVPGIYTDWPSAQAQIIGWSKPRHKKFETRAEAEEFVRAGQVKVEAGADGLVSGPDATKKRRISEASTIRENGLPGAPGMTVEDPSDENGILYEAGDGPLPLGAEDGFDPNVILDSETGKVVYKAPAQRTKTKLQQKQKSPPGMLKIYTDGSALGGGRPGAKAGVGVYFGPGDDRNLSAPLAGPRQTNQRAELTAILRAIDIAPRHRDITIFTDSQYAINCVTVWFINWRKNGWMTAGGKKVVENKDLVERVLVKIDERNVLGVKTLFQWVKGHASDEGNIAADLLAVNGARNSGAVES